MLRYLLMMSIALSPIVAAAHSLTDLPLGDQLRSNAPQKNHLWPCRVEADAGGAFNDGPWINKAAGTYDRIAKPHVPGDVKWPNKFSVSLVDGKRIFASNDLPDHGTGTYPIPSNSVAYQYDRNPNGIKPQALSFSLPSDPQLAAQASCAPGAVGILLSGVALFSAIDAPGRDAMAHEVQDNCDGHPQVTGVYHYHALSSCVADHQMPDGSSGLVGYAIDGFGIYGSYQAGGKKLDSKDLDECHGLTSEVLWDGKKVSMYHYVATDDFPYTVGCIKGSFDLKLIQVLSGPRPWFWQ